MAELHELAKEPYRRGYAQGWIECMLTIFALQLAAVLAWAPWG